MPTKAPLEVESSSCVLTLRVNVNNFSKVWLSAAMNKKPAKHVRLLLRGPTLGRCFQTVLPRLSCEE